MKLYAGFAPNAFRVLAFLVEKNIELPITSLDVMQGQTRHIEHLERNSLGEIPVLELEDGTILTESIAICQYLESIHPDQPLLGTNPIDRARIEMWNRRMEQRIMEPHGQLGLHTISIFADKVEQLPEYADTQRRLIPKRWAWLDTELADGRKFIAGDGFSIADITCMTALMIGGFIDIEIPRDLANVQRWVKSVQRRDCWNDWQGLIES